MKAYDVLETHLRLLRGLSDTPLTEYAKWISRYDPFTKAFENSRVNLGGLTFGQFLHAGVAQAPTIWVTSDVIDEVDSLAQSYRVEEGVPSTVLPGIATGVAVLDKPIRYTEATGYRAIVHVVTWAMVLMGDHALEEPVPAVQVMLWNDARREIDDSSRAQIDWWRGDGEYNAEYIRKVEQLFPMRQFAFAPGHTKMGEYLFPVPEDARRKHRDNGYDPPERIVNNGRLMVALMELIGRMPEPDEDGVLPPDAGLTVGKSLTRRAQKAGIRPRVVVAPLHQARGPRREPDPNREKGTRAPVGHHVTVRAHTRMQAYGPGRSLRKEIEIESYGYGPEDPPEYTPPPKVYRVGKGDTSGR